MTRPYPEEFDRPAAIGAGMRLRIRPIRPDDQPRLLEMDARMTPDDRRLRFFVQTKGISPELAARFTQIDYDREMALIATPLEHDTLLGVARYAAEPGMKRAEFALAVRSDWHHRGLGQLLMTRLIEVAKRRGIAVLYGDVLRENAHMFDLCRHLGFGIEDETDDPAVLRLSLMLSTPEIPAP